MIENSPRHPKIDEGSSPGIQIVLQHWHLLELSSGLGVAAADHSQVVEPPLLLGLAGEDEVGRTLLEVVGKDPERRTLRRLVGLVRVRVRDVLDLLHPRVPHVELSSVL
jgi:hypothetical protein